MRTLLFFSFLLLSALIIPLASANTVSFSNIHLVDSQKLDIYEIDGSNTTYLGQFNSTDSIELDPASNYQIVLKPSKMDWYQSMHSIMDYMTTTDGGQLITALAFFAVFGGGFIVFGSRMWNK